ncbi:MAG TPA: hypothetical protein VGG99_10840 [Acetobacteraceae bacterium]
MRGAGPVGMRGGGILPDTDVASRRIEAHIFEQISFAKDVLEMRVSERDINTAPSTLLLNGTLDDAGYKASKQTLRDNARKFATRNGIKLVWVP